MAFIKIPLKYSDYSNIFLAKNIAELSENTKMNKHAIELEDDKQPTFRPIYSLEQVELETLKTYMKTNPTNSFVQLSKSLAGAPILFDKKPNRSFCLCINYWSLYHITIKNPYLIPLISELLNRLGQTKRLI